nr:hypothetical protein [Streptomyces cyaneogriseus]
MYAIRSYYGLRLPETVPDRHRIPSYNVCYTKLLRFEHSREVLAPYKRIRRLEFGELPKTISGKIRRIELREATAAGSDREYLEADFR